MEKLLDIGPGLLLAGALLLAFAFVAFMTRRRKPKPIDAAQAEAVEQARLDAIPRCVCGEVATQPRPTIERERSAWNWLRTYLHMPPRYRRGTDTFGAPVYCASHVHVADALTDEKLSSVRQGYATAHAKVAADIAAFESESLPRAVRDSLTDDQKRAQRKPALATVRPIQAKTGTEEA